MASTPAATACSASSRVVAEENSTIPAAFSRAMTRAGGRPKWKLTTAGRVSTNRSSIASSATKLV